MTVFARSPQPGDWVRTTETVHTGVVDALVGSGIGAGAQGVVLSRTGSQAEVELHDGWGRTRVTVPARALHVTRRDGGAEAFRARSSRLGAIRLGAFVAMVAPVALFVVQYLLRFHTFDGIVGAFALGTVDAGVQTLQYLFTNPVHAVLFLAVGWVTSAVAFGRRHR